MCLLAVNKKAKSKLGEQAGAHVTCHMEKGCHFSSSGSCFIVKSTYSKTPDMIKAEQ